jgi:hypothetical protein
MSFLCSECGHELSWARRLSGHQVCKSCRDASFEFYERLLSALINDQVDPILTAKRLKKLALDAEMNDDSRLRRNAAALTKLFESALASNSSLPESDLPRIRSVMRCLDITEEQVLGADPAYLGHPVTDC